MKHVILEGERLREKKSLYAELAEKFNNPDFGRMNLDALNDSLGELVEKPRVSVMGTEAVLGALPLFRVLRDNGLPVRFYGDLVESIRRERLIAIIRGVSARDMPRAAEALIEGGIPMMEVTFGAADTCEAISAIAGNPKAIVGAGTVMTEAQVQAAHDAGAVFVISPNVNPAVIAKTKQLGMISIPGALTPAGDAYQVYPGEDGQPVETIRLMQVEQAIQDMRAMQLLESLIGREKVIEIIDEGIEPITFDRYPHDEAYVLGLRKRINAAIEKAL